MFTRFYRRLPGQPGLEECYYVLSSRMLEKHEMALIRWFISEQDDEISCTSHYSNAIEVGPRLSVETPFSSNVTSILARLGVPVVRIERSLRAMSDPKVERIEVDPLTQQVYPEPLTNFGGHILPEPVRSIPFLEEGEAALRAVNAELGLGMDDWDIAYVAQMYQRLNRDPTDVELIQLGNGNSEHSRHHFFRGIHEIDGAEMPKSLMDVVKKPWKSNPGVSLVAFHDNGGVICGGLVELLVPERPGQPSPLVRREVLQHITATAETHNHPTMIAPFPGAETGAGGRIRDIRAVGRGGLAHAGFAGYCVGNLDIEGHAIPGELQRDGETGQHASPLQILIRGSDGVSDYGNKIGEPLLGGFVRSFGLPFGGVLREFRKPVLYTAGLGRIDDQHVRKHEPQVGMLIVRIGGPAYRIGVGGGAASSIDGGTNTAELDLKSVQRGDPEMENRANRVIQACAEMGDQNPIESIHDQGAGGPSNVLTELMDPLGGLVDIRKIVLGDKTMSTLEIWVAEYQEGYGLLVRPENLEVLKAVCEREGVNCEVPGVITGDRTVVLVDSADGTTPVNLPLDDILLEIPRKRFISNRIPVALDPLSIPERSIAEHLEAIFLLPQVGSKGFLVHKADRSVTGLVAQQQCCGEMQVAVADAAVTADGYSGFSGAVATIGEQPIKVLVNSGQGARMSAAEMLTNMAGVPIEPGGITCRVNWMWPAKLPGEGPRLYDAAVAVSNFLLTQGVVINGGKDSLSMTAKMGGAQIASPGQLVIFGHARVPDITKVVTPDFKGSGRVGLIDLGNGKDRLGGSSLAQAYWQVGDDAPDIEDLGLMRRAFEAVQELVRKGLITAYHDRSDGGLVTTLAEMAIAGNCGASIKLRSRCEAVPALFNEEAGMVFEYSPAKEGRVKLVLSNHRVPWFTIGSTDRSSRNLVVHKGRKCLLDVELTTLRGWWEATSSKLDALQANPETAAEERSSFEIGRTVRYECSPLLRIGKPLEHATRRPKVAIVREEGSNGDREMAAAFMAAGFEPTDVSMNDIRTGAVDSLDRFQGVAFPGGFSFADAGGSARGWAMSFLFEQRVRTMFDRFYNREDTFSLGVCNGFQLMTTIGWLPERGMPIRSQPRLGHNRSARFESRWSAVRVLPSPALMMNGMEGAVLGIHVAHGEGKLYIPDPHVADSIRRKQLVPLAYVDMDGAPTEAYPYNPNGSPEGWTALCSEDGRHLGMMPHPERCFLPWQWPHVPRTWHDSFEKSPWLRMFDNARNWCLEH